jgi:signal transduction histidine kinase
MTAAPVSAATATALASISSTIVERGGSVLIPESDQLLADPSFRIGALGSIVPHATLAYGEPLTEPGFHVVASETDHWVENLTGLGGCGAHLVLAIISEHARQGHPMIPVVQVAEASQRATVAAEDIDLFLTRNASDDEAALERLLVAVAERICTPVANAQGFVDFQFTRGLLGVTS